MYLLSDIDKMNLMFCCSRFYYFIDLVYYNDIYDYYKVQNLSFVDKFKKIRYLAINDSIPSVITHLELDKSFVGSLKNCQLPRLSHIKLTQSQYNSFKEYISLTVEIDYSRPPTYFKYIGWDIETYSNPNVIFPGRISTNYYCPVESSEGPKTGLIKTCCFTAFCQTNYYQPTNSQQIQPAYKNNFISDTHSDKSNKKSTTYSTNTKFTLKNILKNIPKNTTYNIPKIVPKIVPKNTNHRNLSKKYRH
ncbi:hypothetical protein QJ850_gp802 [Acanthamoeba polyphaga mimivirus]|uniref:Uncharacterized protein n=1 Tax=Acanthamoeba polyphaga mimivirus Kroon TaxID=3069720 RepID=A0A0G2Y7U5_9VIRU|nr:hypothetical protein QJ850_gp802 [Acanthamoeba polyphaga mimivirus]AKI79897.1 hypothetical protein [Acanthamoeba polyphaga mimivirus Kroon]